MSKTSQNNQVLQYMREHGSITSLEAFTDLSITRLSGRIYDLKQDGHIIKSEMEEYVNKAGEKSRYARYSLVE